METASTSASTSYLIWDSIANRHHTATATRMFQVIDERRRQEEMRIKQSFVTNSSSSSFVAFGRGVEKDQIYKNIPLLQAIRGMYIEKGDKNEHLDRLLQSLIEGKDPNREDPKNLRAYDIGFDTYLDDRESLLVYHEDYDNGDFYIGISPYAMEMDETKGQVYEKIVKQFADFLFINITLDDISYIEEAWMDN